MRALSGVIFLANFIVAAIYLDAMRGLAATFAAFISTAIIWYAEVLGGLRTDYFMRRWMEGGEMPPEDSSTIVIDKPSRPPVVAVFGWVFLVMSTTYTAYLILG